MADYINKNILSQAYIHIEPSFIGGDLDVHDFEEKITAFVKSRTSFFLSPDAIIEIEFEKGSLKSRITVMGTILLLLQGVANYKDFREGIQYLYSDTKRLAEYIISESLFETKSKNENIIRLEARAGIIGSVQKVINQLDMIKRGAEGLMEANEIVTKLVETKIEIEKLCSNINDDNDKDFVVRGLHDLAHEIPNNPIPPRNKFNTAQSVAIFKDERKKLLELLDSKTVNNLLH